MTTMSHRRTGLTPSRIIRGTAAFAVAAALGIGAPIGLIRAAGWPFPKTVPGWDAFTQPIPDELFVHILAIVCWLAWAQLMTCLIAEIVACLRGSPTPRLPASRTAQRLAGWLVASFMALPVQAPQVATAAPLRTPARYALTTTPTSVTAATAMTAPGALLDAPASPTMAKHAVCTVGPRDTLWSIADRHLGDPRRWPEIYELNRDRPQTVGGSLTNPRRIRAGWTLRLPFDAQSTAIAAAGNVAVVPGDSLSAIAGRRLGDPGRWPEVFELNRGKPQPDGRSLLNPNVIRPGWVLRLTVERQAEAAPPAPEPARRPVDAEGSNATPTTPSTQVSTPQSPTTTPPVTTHPSGEGSASADHRPQTAPVPTGGLFGAGLAAVGLVIALDRIRRARARRRQPGTPPSLPAPTLERTELRLRADAGERAADVERLDICVRALGAALARDADHPRPSVVAVQVAADGIEFLLAERCPTAPEGFTMTDDGWAWRNTTADIENLRSSASRVAPLPALVTLGAGVGGTVLFDLEAAGMTAVAGNAEDVRRLLHQFIAELATSSWADHLDVVVIGEERLGIGSLPRIRHSSDVTDTLEELRSTAATRRTALGDQPSTFAARTSGDGGDGWAPTIVVCLNAPDDDAAASLAALVAEAGTGIGVVVAGSSTSARWTLHCHRETIETEPLGLRVTAAGLDETALRAASDLFAHEAAAAAEELVAAAQIADVRAQTASVDGDCVIVLPGSPPAAGADDEPYEEEPFDVEVRFLGRVDVVGSDQPIEGGRPLDLIAYLAVHPEGADGDRLKTVLWPPNRPAPAAKTFANVVSLTRGLIGARHFPAATSEVYRLAKTVTTDVARFTALVSHARDQVPAKAAATLRTALEMVRGEPFAGATQGFHWVQPEGHYARIEALVVDTAHRLVELCLAAGDPSGADWAARQGLLASPGNEILYRDRMRAGDAAGNPTAVHAAMAELCDVLEADDPTDRVHPDTLALYDELTSKWSKRATG